MAKKVNRPEPSELVSIEMKCGACKTTNKVSATFEVDAGYKCGGCSSRTEDFYTCMCESGKKTVEAQCPSCKYNMVVGIE